MIVSFVSNIVIVARTSRVLGSGSAIVASVGHRLSNNRPRRSIRRVAALVHPSEARPSWIVVVVAVAGGWDRTARGL